MARVSTSSLLLLTAMTAAFANEPPLCEFYTPGERCLCDDFGLSVFAEGLYLVAKEHNLSYALSNTGLEPTNKIPPALDRWNFQGDMLRLEPHYSFGWRFGLGYTSPCDYWDLFVYWTSFSTDQGKQIDIHDLPAYNIWGYPDISSSSRLFDLRGDWQLKYDLINLEFGRAFWIGRCLTLRPLFGVETAFIDQSYNIDVEYEPLNFTAFGSTLKMKSDFCGTGLVSGFVLHFTSGTGFGLYGKISLSLLYGEFKTSMQQTESFATAPMAPPTESLLIADSSDNFHMGLTGFQGILGVNWNRSFCCNRYQFELHLTWEFNQWNDLNKFPHYSTALNNGIYGQANSSLTLMGLTFGGGFDF